MQTILERFEDKFIEHQNGCWVWVACTNSDGYGQLRVKGKSEKAHRISWEIYNDRKIPSTFIICHTCDNPSCVNPNHLVCRDNQWNADDKYAKGRGHHPKGEDLPKAKLTWAEVEMIRALYVVKNKTTRQELADSFNVSEGTIQDIVYRRTWKGN